MIVATRREAFEEANKLMTTDYEYDTMRSSNAGYPIYYSTADGVNEWISDLNSRIEVNRCDGSSVNIWIKPRLERAGFHLNSLGIWVM